MIYIQIPHEVKYQCVLAIIDLEFFQNNEKWTRCNYPNRKWY